MGYVSSSCVYCAATIGQMLGGGLLLILADGSSNGTPKMALGVSHLHLRWHWGISAKSEVTPMVSACFPFSAGLQADVWLLDLH